jgi:hypothetical protein
MGGGTGSKASEPNVEQIVPVTQTFTHFYCRGPKPTAASTDVFTVVIDGSATTTTCTIPTNQTVFTNQLINLTVTAGHTIAVRLVQGNNGGQVSFGLAP